MGDYKLDKTFSFEERGIQFLKSIGFNIESNNMGEENKTKTDYKILKNKTDVNKGFFFVDFQFSSDFALYGDIRVDIISAYYKKDYKANNDIYQSLKKDLKIFNLEKAKEELENIVEVKKYGKLFDEELNSILFFIFNKNEKSINENDIPDIITIIPRKTILKFLELYPNKFLKSIKFNDKSEVKDAHGSAFITVPLSALYSIEPFFIVYSHDIKKSFMKQFSW